MNITLLHIFPPLFFFSLTLHKYIQLSLIKTKCQLLLGQHCPEHFIHFSWQLGKHLCDVQHHFAFNTGKSTVSCGHLIRS